MPEIFEVGTDPDWKEIRQFTMNTLHAESETIMETTARAAYFSAQSHVLVSQRLDRSIGLVQDYLMNAAQHVGKVSERGTKLLVEASDRATERARVQSEQADKHARSLKHATWVLTGATAVLAIATIALVLYTRQLALNERTVPQPASRQTSADRAH